MASYYTRISLQRMGQLLNLNLAETEEILSQLVISGTVRAKTDRPTGVVHFSHSQVCFITSKFNFTNIRMMIIS